MAIIHRGIKITKYSGEISEGLDVLLKRFLASKAFKKSFTIRNENFELRPGSFAKIWPLDKNKNIISKKEVVWANIQCFRAAYRLDYEDIFNISTSFLVEVYDQNKMVKTETFEIKNTKLKNLCKRYWK